MVSSISTIKYNLSLLNQRNEKVTYQMSSGDALQYGSDNSQQYNQILSINNNVNSYSSILERIQLSTAYNTTSDSAVASMKTKMESVESLVKKAITDTTSSDSKVTIADEIESYKNAIYSLANSNTSGQYLFSGNSSSTQAFQKDATTGKITYIATNDNKSVNVETGSYTTQGVNGIDLLYYTNNTAQAGEDLTFDENEIILDKDGNQYKLLDNDNDGSYDGLYLDGDSSNTPLTVTDNGDGSFTVNNSGTTALQSKHSIFDDLDKIINALKQQDSSGNTITEDEATTLLSDALSTVTNAYDTMNITHAKLGTRTASIENYEDIVQTKLSNFDILQENYSAADVTALAIESQSLESTYTALYSTINKVNNLSLVKYLNS